MFAAARSTVWSKCRDRLRHVGGHRLGGCVLATYPRSERLVKALRHVGYRLSSARSDKTRDEYTQAVAVDGLLLLQPVYDSQARNGLARSTRPKSCVQTWVQQFYCGGAMIRPRSEDESRPPAGRLIVSPYDVDALWGS